MDVVTKSGTNDLHGGVWEFLRNDAFDARNFFRAGITPLRQNQFGGNAGGPVVIPKLYNGRNHTFIFGSYQGFRQSFANSGLYRVPTPAEMAGNLSGERPIFDPFCARPDPGRAGQFLRDPFPGNMIPAGRIDPIATKIVSTLYPQPLNTGLAGTNGINTRPNTTDQDMYTFRVDHQMSRDSLSYRYSHVKTPVVTSGDGGGVAGSTFLREAGGYNQSANCTHIFDPATIFHFLFARSYIDLTLRSKWDNANESDLAPQLFSESFACGFVGGYGGKKCYIPFIQIPGIAGVNEF